ncbi:hypothetical protein HIM_11589 [Hirsutella minnesotensis 3608]|uniref:Uncharacterized protein n=1 Tax=Hirsutella minnesotensis 3608 TaxID=1043627 RepID=A0A0F8A0Z7_9HYPO|nr:hypothetical protein HIM_11589 [Hirsutella minnesotensis 3608]
MQQALHRRMPPMTEIVVAVEVAAVIGDVVQGLYGYISAVKSAKGEILNLTRELSLLKNVLNCLDVQCRSDPDLKLNKEIQVGLRHTQDTVLAIQKKLGHSPSKVGSIAATLSWPFRSGDVDNYLLTLERWKTWFSMVIMLDSKEAITSMDAKMQRLSLAIDEVNDSQKTDSMRKEADKVVKWLAPFEARVAGPCQWIWDTDLAAWEDSRASSTQPIFWITGRSGSGKTTLFSSIVDELERRCTADEAARKSVGFHCCSLDVAASQPINNVFGSIFAQIATADSEVVRYFQPMTKSGPKRIPRNNMTTPQICEAMQFLLDRFDCFYLLIDALNERPCGNDDDVIETLITLCKKHANLRVLITSTREPFLDSDLIFFRIMSEEDVNLDIKTYVQRRLQTERIFKSLDPAIQSTVSNHIVTSSHGTFRWAKLCMDHLSRSKTAKAMKISLRDMPLKLNEVYAAMLCRIPDDDKKIAREALTWLCFSLRPLHLHELAEAVVLHEEDTFLDSNVRLINPVVLLEICQDLIYSSDDELTLAHDSIRSFLLSDGIRTSKAAEFALDPASAHRKIMRKCLTYLSLDEFATGPVSKRDGLRDRFTNYPLLGYASQLWPIHSKRFDLQLEDENDILAFFETKRNPNSGTFGAWVQLLLGPLDLDCIHRTEPLYYVASYNMVPILKILLRPGNGVDVNKRGGRYSSTPLFVAVWRGNLEAAKLLYTAGADPRLVDGAGIDSYEMAVHRHLDELVEVFDGNHKSGIQLPVNYHYRWKKHKLIKPHSRF